MTMRTLPQHERVKRILVIKLMHYGDVLLMTPLLRTLKKNYPQVLIDVLVYKDTDKILAGNEAISIVYTIDRQLKYQGVREKFSKEQALFKALSAQSYDLCLNLSDRWRAALYCRFLNIKYSLGFLFPKRDNLLWRYCHSELVHTEQQVTQHAVLNNLDILKPLKLAKIDTDVVMTYQAKDIARIEQLCSEKNIDQYILIQPTARWKFKMWSAQAFSQLINTLTAQGQRIILSAGPADSECAYVEQIIRGCASTANIINLAGSLSLTELAALMDRAKLFIGVDSVAMHMAAALKTPSVVLFGPSNLKQWHPWQVPHTLIWAGNYRQLPKVEEVDTATEECYLAAIPVEDVVKAVKDFL